MTGITRSSGRKAFVTAPEWHFLRHAGDRDPSPLVLALHGIGENGALMAERLQDLVRPGRALLCPDAPCPYEIRSEDGGRREGRAWYVFTGDQDRFIAQATAAGDWIDSIVDDLVREGRVAEGPIVLCGYSQGGYLAGMLTLLRPGRVRALVVVSSRLKHELLDAPATSSPPSVDRPPILAIHGEKDRIVEFAAAQASARRLGERGIEVAFRPLPGGHRFTPDRVATIAAWLDERGL